MTGKLQLPPQVLRLQYITNSKNADAAVTWSLTQSLPKLIILSIYSIWSEQTHPALLR